MKKRTYYSINEGLAKQAHEMMSMRDYRAESKTAEYRSLCDKAYDLADKVAEVKPSQAERAYMLAEKYAKKMAVNMNKNSSIGCMCPSIMISGGSNFPVRKKEKQNKAWEKNMEEYNQIQNILKKIKNILFGKEIIKSGDEDAIEKLEEKLEDLKDKQESMKAINKAIRKKDTEQGNEELRNMGYSDEQIVKFREPDFCGRIGFPQYALQNNNANIHRVENRLQQLKEAKEKGNQEVERKLNDETTFKVVENTEIMRIQLFFDDKPEPEVRQILKSNGFRWAPSQSAWQRQLTNNGKYALKRVLEMLKNQNN